MNSHSPAKAGILAAMLFLPATAGAAQSDCPRASRIGNVRVIEFADGSLAMRTALEVNTDGAKTSYMEKDRGINYVANGIARWVRGDTDIRAKIALASVDVVILGNAKLPMRGNVIETEVTTQALRERLDTANYTSQQIRGMAECLDQL